jgi:hypothetical protein
MPDVRDQVLLNLAVLRENPKKMMHPEVLRYFADFLTATGEDDNTMLDRFKFFAEHSEHGTDCSYAVAAKQFFLRDQACDAAKAIIWLYHNWAKSYDKPQLNRRTNAGR